MQYDENALHIMLDTEYIGNGVSPVVISIGAAAFKLSGNGLEKISNSELWDRGLASEFYRIIDIDDSVKAGLGVDKDTLNWWIKNNAARWPDQDHAVGLTQAMNEFHFWYKAVAAQAKVKAPLVWTHRMLYDGSAIVSAFKAGGLLEPWRKNQQDGRFGHVFRDTMTFYETVGYQCHAAGTAQHNALDDAKAQILEMQAAWRLGKKKGL